MSQEVPDEDQRLEVWLPRAIDRMIESKGRVKGQFDSMDKDKSMFWGTYSWLTGIVTEQLSSYRVMDELNDERIFLRKMLTTLIGLDEDSDNREIAKTAKEMREIFVEMRRVRGERESSRSNET